MEDALVKPELVQSWSVQQSARYSIHRWQKYLDGDGKLWIVAGTFGFTDKGVWGANVELLNVDDEMTIDVPRAEFDEWVLKGTLKRENRPILS